MGFDSKPSLLPGTGEALADTMSGEARGFPDSSTQLNERQRLVQNVMKDVAMNPDKLLQILEVVQAGINLDPEVMDSLNSRFGVQVRNPREPNKAEDLLEALAIDDAKFAPEDK